MTRICFEDGFKFNMLIVAEILQMSFLIFGFVYSNTVIFAIGIFWEIANFILFIIWIQSGRRWHRT